MAAAVGLGIGGAAFAQVAPDAGTTLRELETPLITLPRKPTPAIEFSTPARPALEPAPAVRFTLRSFRIVGTTAFTALELQALLQEYVGREVGIAELGEAVGRITGFYVARGYPLATAYLPAQSIEGGVAEIVVLEGRYGKVQFRNRANVNDSTIASYLEGLQGSVVEDPALERQLLLLYDLAGMAPGRALLSPGEEVGETDLRVELEPGRRVAGTVELNNHGSRFSGANRVSAQLDWFSPARLGDWLSVRAAKGDPGLEHARIGYEVPIFAQGLRIGGAYSHIEYRLGEAFAALAASGEADSQSLYASYPVLRSRQHNVYGRLGHERRQLQDRIDTTATVTDRQSGATTLTLSGDYFDLLGAGAASAYSLGLTGGALRIDSPAAKAIDDATARTNGSFRRWNLSYVRQQGITDRTAVFVSLTAQKSSKNLDSSEKMILGGVNGVRAYPQGEAPGDSGVLVTAELRHAFGISALPGNWQAACFIDTGEVKINEEPFSAAANRRRLSGGGVRLDWSSANDFTLRLVLAHRIGDEPATAGRDSKARAWLQAIKYF
jgi:hemolysin activation/secretion protein